MTTPAELSESRTPSSAEAAKATPPQQTKPALVLVSSLAEHGVSNADVLKLAEAGLTTVKAVVLAGRKRLLAIKGVSEAKADNILAIGHNLFPSGFIPASMLKGRRSTLIRITTGSSELNKILGGGVETGSITEWTGEAGTGKSQVCHTLAVACQLPVDKGGGAGKCLWVDTEGTFRTERLLAAAARFELDACTVLGNVTVGRAYNSEHQMKLLVNAASFLSVSRYTLVVIDSATALFRTDFLGRGELYDRQTRIKEFIRLLKRLADEFGVAVVVSNQVVARVNDGAVFSGPANVPVGGDIVAHATTTRITLRKARGATRVARLIASPCLPEAEASFAITKDGIDDVAD